MLFGFGVVALERRFADDLATRFRVNRVVSYLPVFLNRFLVCNCDEITSLDYLL